MKKPLKVGLVAMSSISVGGGTARISFDLIQALNSLGHKVYVMTPFKVDFQKIKKRYGSGIEIEKVYTASKWKYIFYRDRDFLARWIMKKEFKKMSEEVDVIIDIDGGIVHDYLPEDFDKRNYVVWRIGGARVPETPWIKTNLKKQTKKIIRKILRLDRNTLDDSYRIYPVDEWTKKNVEKYWKLNLKNKYLYPAVQVGELLYKNEKKKNQIIVFGRIAPNKRIEESIEIFARGIKNYPDYKLIIIGGTTCDSKQYIDYLIRLAKDLGILEKIKIVKNPCFENLKKILLESKILIEAENINITMTSIECIAAACIVLAPKTSGTYSDVLDYGKYGFGYEGVDDGGRELEKILDELERGKLNPTSFMKRAEFFSKEKFVRTIKAIIEGDF